MAENDVKQQLQDDLKAAMKAQDVTARETIRFTMAAIKNAEIEHGGPLTADQTLALLQRETKRRVDSIDQFRAAGRDDLVTKEEEQLAVLKKYMPRELSDAELETVVRAAIASTGAESVKDLGKVMPVVIAEVAGGADGKRISAMVRSLLS
ncbi:MAG: GatB/YqeY domain-containing protein [Thermomicrobiales bacterium]|nr:GatB/YqeY domain-containing protein [Thermomicrobiales bacterium]